MADALLDDLLDWLRIPSISTGGGHGDDLRRAAEWVTERVAAAGGEAALVDAGGNPIAYGELRAAREDAPTVLIYGHYDVQGAGPLDAWKTPPFEPAVREGRVWARGASDDKGNFLPLLHVACEMARAGELPVHVRVCVEGEEEVGGASAVRWLRADERGADCAIVFDGAMADPQTPAIMVGLRGMVMCRMTVRTGRRDLHSGIYGGSVLNALHVLQDLLAPLLPGPYGRLREELRAGVIEPAPEEVASWQRLLPGDRVIADAGGRPLHPGAGAEYYMRNGADASLDVNWITGGEPRTVVPATAQAAFSVRLAPGQDSDAVGDWIEKTLRAALPAGAELELTQYRGQPALFDVGLPAMRLAADAIDRATGLSTALIRTGGSIPIVAEFAAKGIPAIVTGFALADDEIHAPNESYRLESLDLGQRAARELYTALARLR